MSLMFLVVFLSLKVLVVFVSLLFLVGFVSLMFVVVFVSLMFLVFCIVLVCLLFFICLLFVCIYFVLTSVFSNIDISCTDPAIVQFMLISFRFVLVDSRFDWMRFCAGVFIIYCLYLSCCWRSMIKEFYPINEFNPATLLCLSQTRN